MSIDVYADNTVTTRIPKQLIKSDIAGKGAAQIGWGSPGDFDRCLSFARRHGIPKHMQKGFCANLHKLATGEWPGVNAHKAAMDYLIAAATPVKLRRWEGPLAPIGTPTGDRRMFPAKTLTYQTFPMPLRWQEKGLPGHQGAVTVGVIEHAEEKDVDGKPMIWGRGYFLDPDIIGDVNKALHLAEHGVLGASVDLDSYTALASKHPTDEGPVAVARKGRVRSATLVAIPAFSDLRLRLLDDDAVTAAVEPFAVNAAGWRGAPIAPREALFDADDAAKRIEAWANGDPAKLSKMFLWIADSPNQPLIGRRGYRLPWGDIIDDKPYLIFHAVYAAAALLEGAHGGLPAIPDEDKGKLRTVISEIYQQLAREYDDGSIIAPWDRQAQVQQASGDLEPDDYARYLVSFDAALQEFRGRDFESKHPRDKRKNDHAGEWVDVPKHDAHGRIKVGSKWVYPPKKGEKGHSSPEAAVKAIAQRGGGSSTPKKAAATRVVRRAQKPSPDKGSSGPAKKAAPKRRERSKGPHGDDHAANLRSLDNRLARKRYLEQLDSAEIKSLNKELGGTELDDDTRDDLETEILRQIDKPSAEEADKERERKDGQAKKQDRELREIGHPTGSKTVIAKKKKPAPKKPEPQTPAKPTSTTTVGKKQHKLTPAQTKAIEDLKNDPNAKIHPATRKVLEREGLIPQREDRKPEAPKKPGGSTTTVGKKAPAGHKLTPTQKRALGDVRDLGPSGAKVHPTTRKVLQREGYLNEHGGLTDKGRRAIGMPERKEEPKKPEPKPEAPKPDKPAKPTQTLAAKHKLTQNQKNEILALHRFGPVNIGLMNKQTRAALEKKGLIDTKGNLTEEGKKVGKELSDAAPKPTTPTLAKPDYTGKPQLGNLTAGTSPRPVPKSSRPKGDNPDFDGPQRPRAQSRRERELKRLQEQLATAEKINSIVIRQWEESLERAKREGGDVEYYQRGLDQAKTNIEDTKARISFIKGQGHDTYWDTPEVDPKALTGTPTLAQIDTHVASIMSRDIPAIYKPQVEGQLKHQGKIAPRSLSTLSRVRVSPDRADFGEEDNTYAYYQPAHRDITMSHRFYTEPVTIAESLQRNANTDWLHHPEDGTTGFEAILAHEFGHHVAYRALAHERSEELLKAVIKEYGLRDDTPVSRPAVEAALRANAGSIKEQISNYGASSIQELLAETWAEYTNGGKHLRPNVKRIGELMQELAEDLDVSLL